MNDVSTITVKSLKEWISNIPDDLNDKKLVIDNFQPYSDGYNPVTVLQQEPVDVVDNFQDGETETESAVVIRIM